MLMTTILVACVATSTLALAVSTGRHTKWARRLGLCALLLILGVLPIATLADVIPFWADDTVSKARRLGRTISHMMNYGIVALPCAVIAVLALHRARKRPANQPGP